MLNDDLMMSLDADTILQSSATDTKLANDCRVFKRFLKSFLGGKKVVKN